jgi:hypothetical protein
MEDAVKTVTNDVKNLGFMKSHFELSLVEIETVFGGLLICRIVQWFGHGCVCDGVVESVVE